MTEVELGVQKVADAPADAKMRITRRIEVGFCVQQGDVYIFRVDPAHPHGKQIGMDKHQVALGAGNGARHVAEGALDVFLGTTAPEWMNLPAELRDAKELIGPVVIAKKRWTLTHPEHPHHSLPAGCYQVTYQYNPQTMRRVAD